jgi:hypothetical protein
MKSTALTTDGAPSEDRLSFSGHETFVFRHAWLKKAVDAVADDPTVFSQESAIVTLGVGKNMVRSIRHWALATGVIAEEPKSRGMRVEVTPFGQVLLGKSGFDQYLEDPNTLWLLHWKMLKQEQRCTTWNWVFNRFPSTEFTRAGLTQFILDEAQRAGAPAASENSIRRDVEVFLRTYAGAAEVRKSVGEEDLDCPFAELGLIEAQSHDVFLLHRGPKQSLGDHAFVYALCDFWNGISEAQQTLALSEIAYRKGSPGTVFRLDENSLSERLERLETVTEGRLVYAETAGLRQVYRHSEITFDEMLQTHYAAAGELLDVEVFA